MVGQVRSFNRTVTQRIGALDDAFLSRDRPLGQARLLWEIGPDGCDVRRLRSRLDLDSGYREVAAFSDEPYAHHWFEKTLDRPAGAGYRPPESTTR